MNYTLRWLTFVQVSLIRYSLAMVLVSLVFHANAQTTCRILLSDPADTAQKVAVFHKRTFIETLYKPFKPFIITVDPTDTLYIMSREYKTVIIAGSTMQGYQGTYDIYLNKFTVNLHEIRIRPTVHLDTLAFRAHRIGAIPHEYKPTYSDIDPLSSPFTALWSQFNSLEQQKRKLAILLEAKDMHDIMVAYFDICNKQGIIDIPTTDYDAFIQYCRFTPQFLQNNTQYDILNTIRYMYIQFTNQRLGR